MSNNPEESIKQEEPAEGEPNEEEKPYTQLEIDEITEKLRKKILKLIEEGKLN
jgi:hypothetical protein